MSDISLSDKAFREMARGGIDVPLDKDLREWVEARADELPTDPRKPGRKGQKAEFIRQTLQALKDGRDWQPPTQDRGLMRVAETLLRLAPEDRAYLAAIGERLEKGHWPTAAASPARKAWNSLRGARKPDRSNRKKV